MTKEQIEANFPPEDLKNIQVKVGGSLKPGPRDDWVEPDQATKDQWAKNAKEMNLKAIDPNPDPALYMNKNPLYCGTLLLSQMVSTEALGIALANHHVSIFAVAHLYNALRNMDLIDFAWPDLERIIALQAGPIFANDIPTTPQEMRARFYFRLGGINGSMTRWRFDDKTMAKKDLTISPASTLLLEFFQAKQPLEKTVYQLQERIEKTKATRSTVSRNTAGSVSLLSQRKFIDQLEDFAKAAISEREIPYLGLAKLCVHLLNMIRSDLEHKGYRMPPKSIPGSSFNDSLILMVGEILKDNCTMNKKGPGGMLQVAATDFEMFWIYLNSPFFQENNKQIYFPNRDPERSEARRNNTAKSQEERMRSLYPDLYDENGESITERVNQVLAEQGNDRFYASEGDLSEGDLSEEDPSEEDLLGKDLLNED